MLSLYPWLTTREARNRGYISGGRTTAAGYRDYYERATTEDWRGLGYELPDESLSTGRWYGLGDTRW